MKIEFAGISSTLSHYASHAKEQIGVLLKKGGEYNVKIIQLTSDYLQNPKYANGGVAFANAGFFIIALQTAYIADKIYDRLQLADHQISERLKTAKCFSLLGTFLGTWLGLNIGFSKALAPNITLKLHALIASVTCAAVPIFYFTRDWLKS